MFVCDPFSAGTPPDVSSNFRMIQPEVMWRIDSTPVTGAALFAVSVQQPDDST